jgi:bifunctional ADP-heptose synthase (sugar kinase/adenylyltransferase)
LDDDGGVIARFDQEDECFPVDVSEIQEKAKNCCAIIVSNYGKGAISNETVLAIEKLDLPTFVDTKVRPDLWASWVEAMFPNEREYALHRSDYREVRTCVVKRGVSGASLLVDGLRVEDVAATCNSPRNVSGAGDTVLASYVAAHMAIVLSHRQDIHRVF